MEAKSRSHGNGISAQSQSDGATIVAAEEVRLYKCGAQHPEQGRQAWELPRKIPQTLRGRSDLAVTDETDPQRLCVDVAPSRAQSHNARRTQRSPRPVAQTTGMTSQCT